MKRLIIFLTLGICLQSCSIRHFQPVLRDSVVVVRIDTTRVLDSVYIDRIREIKTKADTVYITDTKTEYKYRYRDRIKIDTLYQEKVVTEIQEVEKRLTWWQTFRLKAFWYLAGFLLAWIALKVAKIYLHL